MMFFYIVIEKETFHLNELREFLNYLNESKWNYYISGRKVYFIPEVINKENAVSYLANHLNLKEFGALGDSCMDRGMMKIAKTAYTTKGSPLSKIFKSSKKNTLRGIEEILGIIKEEKNSYNNRC